MDLMTFEELFGPLIVEGLPSVNDSELTPRRHDLHDSKRSRVSTTEFRGAFIFFKNIDDEYYSYGSFLTKPIGWRIMNIYKYNAMLAHNSLNQKVGEIVEIDEVSFLYRGNAQYEDETLGLFDLASSNINSPRVASWNMEGLGVSPINLTTPRDRINMQANDTFHIRHIFNEIYQSLTKDSLATAALNVLGDLIKEGELPF